MIAWPEGVNCNILRESSWELGCGFIEDKTRSGKIKRRAANSQTPDTFNCVLHMTLTEYEIFEEWFKSDCRRGAVSFRLQKINGVNKTDFREYLFTSEKITVNNVGGNVIELNFELREVV